MLFLPSHFQEEPACRPLSAFDEGQSADKWSAMIAGESGVGCFLITLIKTSWRGLVPPPGKNKPNQNDPREATFLLFQLEVRG